MRSSVLKKAITKSAQIVGAGVLLALCAGVAQANLLSNGTFEAGDATAGNFSGAAGWTTFESVFTSANDGPNFAPVSHDDGGNQSLLMFGPFTGTGSAAGAFQSFSVIPGSAHELSAWVMNWVGDPFQNLGILQLSFWDGPNGTGNQLGGAIEQTVDPFGTADVDLSVVQDGADVSDWTRMAVTGVAPTGAVSAKAFLLHIQTGDPCCNGGALYWDDVCTGNLEECWYEYIPPEIPIPSAIWLFVSGLLGLVGMARRKKAT